MTAFHGRCHCGRVTAVFETARDPAGLEVRACGCGFCRRHGARTVSDREGRLTVEGLDGALLYRFGLGITDYVICATCGCYVAALMDEADGRRFGIVGVNVLDDAERFSAPAAPRDYGAEDEAARRARRRRLWTPVAPTALA